MKKSNELLKKIIKIFLASGRSESDEIELSNLDGARLVRKSKTDVVVENEHGTEFPVSDLSEDELETFYLVVKDMPQAKLKTIYKTTIKVEILTDEPVDFGQESLKSICYEMDEGEWSGKIDIVKQNTQLKGKKAVSEVKKQGSDPSFFNLDEDGNDLDEEVED